MMVKGGNKALARSHLEEVKVFKILNLYQVVILYVYNNDYHLKVVTVIYLIYTQLLQICG
jgi:hypothetical protein